MGSLKRKDIIQGHVLLLVLSIISLLLLLHTTFCLDMIIAETTGTNSMNRRHFSMSHRRELSGSGHNAVCQFIIESRRWFTTLSFALLLYSFLWLVVVVC